MSFSPPIILELAAENPAGAAGIDLSAPGSNGGAVAIRITAAQDEKFASIILRIGEDGGGNFSISADEMVLDGETLSVVMDEANLSLGEAQISGASIDAIATDRIRILGEQTVEIGGAKGNIGFLNTVLGAVKFLAIKAAQVTLSATGKIRLRAPRIELSAPSGKLGAGATRGIARQGDSIIGYTSDGKIVRGYILRGSTTWRCG